MGEYIFWRKIKKTIAFCKYKCYNKYKYIYYAVTVCIFGVGIRNLLCKGTVSDLRNKLRTARAFKLAAVLAFAVLLTAVCTVSLSADEARIISGFSGEDKVSWLPGDNVASVGLLDFSWEQDGHAYKRSCLEVVGKYSSRDTLRATVASFDEPLDLTEYLAMSFDIYVPPIANDSDAVFLARLTLISTGGESTEHLQVIESGKWTNIEAYIGSWDARRDIAKAEIAVAIDTSLGGSSVERFYVDDVCVSDPVDRDMTERYLFDAYTVSGGSATVAEDKSKISISSDTDGMLALEAAVFAPELEYSLNCLRIRLANYTDSDTLTLHYSTSDSQVTTEDKIVTVPIEPNSDVRDYFIFVGDAAQLRSIKLILNSALGRVEITSINAISAYEPSEYIACGRLTACTVSDDLTSVKFSGEVDRETAINNRDGYIAIFAHETKTLPSAAELSKLTPLVKTQMTTRFELSWRLPKDGAYDITTRFLAVSVGDDGEYSLICPPFYIQNADRIGTKSTALALDAKGFASNDISVVGSVGATLTLLELDTERLFVQKSEAKPYVYRGEAYYFDGEYLDALNSKMDVLSADGVQVLLRLYGWRLTDSERLDAFYAEDSYVDYSKVNRYNDGGDYIAAIGAYIAENWVADGKIVGVVFGEGENIVTGHSSLSQMVENTASCLRTLYFALVRANPEIKLYVSLSNLYTSNVHINDGEIGLDVYLPALTLQTAQYGQFPWEIAIEKVYRVGSHSREYISVDNSAAVRDVLTNNGASDKHMIFIDHTYFAFASRKVDNLTNYVIGAYGALFCDYIDAYIAATGSRSDEIADSVQYIYTTEAYAIENIVKTALGIDDFSEIIAGFDADKIPQKRVVFKYASNTAPTDTLGSFGYYRFEGVSSIGGLCPSYYSRELRVANDGGNVLNVVLDASLWSDVSSALWLGIGHGFDVPEDLTLTPILAVTLKVEDILPKSLSSVTVKVVLKGKNERFVSSADVAVGEWTTVYVDTDDFNTARDTESLQIFIAGTNVSPAPLKIKSIDGLSGEYNDESLARVIEKTREKKADPDAGIDYGAYLPIALGVLVIAATVIAVVMLTKKRYKENE